MTTESAPICLPCWRKRFSMTEDPPQTPGWPEEKCTLCHRRTNHGIRVPKEDLKWTTN